MTDAPGSPTPALRALRAWSRIDQKIYRAEIALAVLATAGMTALVFMAVVWRVMASPQGKLAQMLVQLTGMNSDSAETLGSVIGAAAWIGVTVFGVRTSKPEWSRVKVLGMGIAGGAGTIFAAWLFVVLLPNGLVFAQKSALALLLWVVLLGSSMAAHNRRHIMLQAAQKLVPPDMLRQHAALSLVVASLFTLFLAWVGGHYAWDNWTNWLGSDMRAGTFESVAIPHWAVTLSFPMGFGLTALRFLGHAAAIWLGELPPIPVDEEVEAAQHTELGADGEVRA